MLMFIFKQSLSEDVSSHVKGWKKYHFHCVGSHLFMNEMDLNADVFTLSMKLGIFNYTTRSLQIYD
jgi:hypothetical protein